MAAALLSYSAASAETKEYTFSYTEENPSIQYFGNEKAETYDMAIRLKNPALIGCQVKSLKVELFSDASISKPKGWLSSELILDSSKNNAPDIASVAASVSEENVLTATFAEPYTITDKGVYVGYSISIDNADTFGDKNPHPVATCISPDGAYIHSSRTNRKWTSLSQYNVAICMEVTLSGNFTEASVAPLRVGNVRIGGEANDFSVPVTVCNLSQKEVATLGYTYAFGESEPQQGSITLATPVNAKFASEATFDLTLPVYDRTTDLNITITSVNGQPNSLAQIQAKGRYTFMTFKPVTRPLMEEYTGLWCGNCPRGFVAMERLNEMYPDEFVCVSYHSNGTNPLDGGEPLQYLAEFPNTPDGFPMCFMNRSESCDPYFGTNNTAFGIHDLWLSLKESEPLADIDVELAWADDAHTRLKCRSTTRFIDDANGNDYRINYIIVGDGFKTIVVKDENDKVDLKESVLLTQHNYFSGSEAPDESPLWNQFVNGGKTCTSLVFNDVAMANDKPSGIQALPNEVKANEKYTHEYEYDYTSMLNYDVDNATKQPNRRNILPEDGKLRCVAVLLTADGKFVNCNKSKALEASTSGVRDSFCDSSAHTIATTWYDLQGRRISHPAAGLNIRVDQLSDGTSRRTKIHRK